MTTFYINQEKDDNETEFINKYDFGKFVDGKTDIPEDTEVTG